MTVPEWISALTDKARKTGLPSAILADAMRARGEDPRDDKLWRERIGQLDIALFGRPARELDPVRQNGAHVIVTMPAGGTWFGTVTGEDYHVGQTQVQVTDPGNSVYRVGSLVWVMTMNVSDDVSSDR